MKDISKIIKESFNKSVKAHINEIYVPDDDTLKKRPSIYSVTHHYSNRGTRQEIDVVKNIFNVGFDFEFARTMCYGDGVYNSYYRNDALQQLGSYGDTIIESKVACGYYRKYIIFSKQEAQDVYGRNWRVEDQIKLITNDQNIIDYISRKYGSQRSSYDGDDMNFGRNEQELCQKLGIKGMVYKWGYGGIVVTLPFDFKSIIPYAVSFDRGKTYQVMFNDTMRQKFTELVDAVFLLKGRYDKSSIGKPVHVKEYNYSFVPIKKYRGWNLVELGSKEMKEVSPVDFDSMTKLNPDDGHFQVEYRGKFYDAWPWHPEAQQGYFEYNGEYLTFDELPNVSSQTRNAMEESIKKSFRKALKEEYNKEEKYQGKYHIPTRREISNAVADPDCKNRNMPKGGFIAYTVTHASDIDNIFRHGFDRSFKGINDAKFSGSKYSWYGDGVYCNFGLDQGLNQLARGKYGEVLIEVLIMGGINRYLIFNKELATAVYGQNHTIKEQVYTLFPKHVADDVWRDMTYIMNKPGNGYTREENHFSNHQSSGLLQQMLYPPYGGLERKMKYEKLFAEYNIRGVIYKGLGDGFCVVPYDFSSAIPIAVYDPVDKVFKQGGQITELINHSTPRKTNYNFNFDYDMFRERIFVKQDDEHKFGHKFQSFDTMAVKGVDIDGNETAYRKVKTFSNEWNYININTGEKISEIDFSSVTIMNPSEDNMFQFSIGQQTLSKLGIKNALKISNMFFDAIPYAYADPISEEWMTFDELPKTLANIDANLNNTTSNRQVDLNNPLGNSEEL